jgi:hypothetical protein
VIRSTGRVSSLNGRRIASALPITSASLTKSSNINFLIWCLMAIVEGSLSFLPKWLLSRATLVADDHAHGSTRRTLDWNSPMSVQQSNLSSWTIGQQHHPIRTGSLAIWNGVSDRDTDKIYGGDSS